MVLHFQRPHHGNCNYPSNKRPAEEAVQKKNGKRVPCAAGEGDDRGKEVQINPTPKKGGSKKPKTMPCASSQVEPV